MFNEKLKQINKDIEKAKQLYAENEEIIKRIKEQNKRIDKLLERIEIFKFNGL